MTDTVERMLPLYEGKMGAQYDHRFGSFNGIGDTDISPITSRADDALALPRYWLREEVVADRIARREWGCRVAMLGHRRVARNTDERTTIASLIPFGAASYGWILSAGPSPRDLALLIAQYNSFIFDYVLRQFLTQPSIPQSSFEQVPALPPAVFDRLPDLVGLSSDWIIDRVLFLVGSGQELLPYIQSLGRSAATPTAWEESTRARCRGELDALFFHLFGLSRSDASYVMDSFGVVKRKDEAAYGCFRTKDLILEIYDAMAASIASGVPFVSPVDGLVDDA